VHLIGGVPGILVKKKKRGARETARLKGDSVGKFLRLKGKKCIKTGGSGGINTGPWTKGVEWKTRIGSVGPGIGKGLGPGPAARRSGRTKRRGGVPRNPEPSTS